MGRIFDAVYGYIELDEIEFALVKSPIFQRLHWIKQLGPLNTIFPSAQHSRFSHSIGVFHIIKKMIDYLEKRKDRYQHQFVDENKNALKLAALLHDIGHVPMSHVGEKVLEKSFRLRKYRSSIKAFDAGERLSWGDFFQQEYMGSSTKLHEALSAEIVLNNKEIDKILSKEWPKTDERTRIKEKIARIIVGKINDVPTMLLHSELDADRLDYLLRDSFFTGVDYGKIDLDYMISRLAVVSKPDDTIEYLCVEEKGLHTIEHYILGRYFLQTQIIYSRKVRFMDLLYEDVMQYMVENKSGKWGLMSLAKLLGHIRYNGNYYRKHLHEIYAYTDAQVFSKMRKLHEELDKKEKAKKANEDEIYINDCVKIIMDGQVSEPVCSYQRLVNLADRMGENFETKTREDSNEIAKNVARKLNIYKRRIKANVVSEKTMRYKPREDEERNRESVKITYKSTVDKDEVIPAAMSKASILKGLTDKALVIFNVYYVPYKDEVEDKIQEKEDAIRKAYQEFVSKYFYSTATGCGCERGRHMCQILLESNGFKEAKRLSKEAKFICQRCGRVSVIKKYLCESSDLH